MESLLERTSPWCDSTRFHGSLGGFPGRGAHRLAPVSRLGQAARQGSSTVYALTGLGIALLVVFLFKAFFLSGAVDMFLVHDVEIIVAGPVVALTFRTTMHRLGGVAVSTSRP